MREKLGVLSVMESSTPINKCDLNSVVTMPCLLCGHIRVTGRSWQVWKPPSGLNIATVRYTLEPALKSYSKHSDQSYE